jgi:hypothetical protein
MKRYFVGMNRAWVLGFFISLNTISCTSFPKKDPDLLHQILLYNLHLRRTESVGADPRAEKGEEFYEINPKPNEKFDCESLSAFYQHVQIASLRECLLSMNRMKNIPSVSYLLVRDPAPFFKLESPIESADCLGRLLPTIPVPREIFFQSPEKGQLECYSARLPIRYDETLGLKSLFHDVKLTIRFPLASVPESDSELLMLLATWSIIPFWEKSERGVKSILVPESLCRKCMGDQNLFSPNAPLPPLWPEL